MLVPLGNYNYKELSILGQNLFTFGYEYIDRFENKHRLSLSTNVEYIQGAHATVNPWRLEIKVTYFPYKRFSDFGFFIAMAAGHDNYNYALLTPIQWAHLGVTWIGSHLLKLRRAVEDGSFDLLERFMRLVIINPLVSVSSPAHHTQFTDPTQRVEQTLILENVLLALQE